ncbi:3-oxoacyl-ACP synthase III family protein [Alkaliphilus transvaalensis]|uniref:3-oxoacyl-ACP synthase III family protein n=1 Tax=Alkaliphilus transvaalensis TaxID=114628 RepID=UPI000B1947C0|nr:3-oxoacyl-ACP synthase [Alkaliphilus transvaalensis]
MKYYVKMDSVASYLPGEPIKFQDINDYLGNFELTPKLDKWVHRIQPMMEEMLSFKYCYYAFDNKTRTFVDDNLSMSVKAAKKALEKAQKDAKEIDLLIYGGALSNQIPPISTRIQEELGIDLCGELHIHANCTSVYKAIKMAHMLLQTGEYKNALVISSNVASSSFIREFYNEKVLTKDDIFLRWYLCDGAGAMVFSAQEEKTSGFYLEDTYMESAGGNKKSAMCNEVPYHWSNPLDDFEKGAHHVRQIYLNDMKEHAVEENGKTIFYNALNRMLKEKNVNLEGLKNFVVNMPSKFVRQIIIDECTDLGIPLETFYSAIEDVGYAGPPAAIISIDNLLQSKEFENNDLIMSFVMEVSKFMQAGFTLRYTK